jgi:ABC-type uncharacterized transport system ATPase subunit
VKNLYVQFGEEEKQHLNYLGSMLGRPNTPEEQEMEDILEAIEKGARSKESLDSLAKRQDHAFQQVALIYSLIIKQPRVIGRKTGSLGRTNT